MPTVITLAAWVLGFSFWYVGWWGAADAKFLMVLSLAFPTLAMLLLVSGANLAVGLLLDKKRIGRRTMTTEQISLPAIPILGLGWLIWIGMTLWVGG